MFASAGWAGTQLGIDLQDLVLRHELVDEHIDLEGLCQRLRLRGGMVGELDLARLENVSVYPELFH